MQVIGINERCKSRKNDSTTKSANKAIKEFYDRQMANINPWCIISIPTISWAKKYFPQKVKKSHGTFMGSDL